MVTYALRLKGFLPETLPLDRLGEYLSALADLIGHDVAASFERVTKGSAVLKIRVPDEAASIVEQRARTAAGADTGTDARRGYDRIEALLRADGTSADFRPGKKGGVILQFPGALRKTLRTASIREYGELNGRVIRLGGRDQTVPVGLQTPDGEVISCTATVEQARRLKEFLLEPVDIILQGMGKWIRTETGRWEVAEFKISGFSVIQTEGFYEALRNVRAEGSGWDSVPDVEAALAWLRYGN